MADADSIRRLMAGFGINGSDPTMGGVFPAGGGSPDKLLKALYAGIPAAHHKHVRTHLHKLAKDMDRTYAAAAAAHMAQRGLQANVSVSLMPSGTTNGLMTPGQVYPCFPMQGGVVGTTPLTFTKDMMFQGVMTLAADSASGLFIVGNSFKFQDDITTGVNQGDLNFAIFEADVHPGRVPLGVYSARRFTSSTALNVSIVSKNASNIACLGGLIIHLRDDRCKPGATYLEDSEGSPFRALFRHVLKARHLSPRTRRLYAA